MKNIFIFLMCFFIYPLPLLAENLTGRICDENNKPISGVNIAIRSLNDCIILAGTQTTSKGTFIVNSIESGKYILSCSHIGYSNYTAEVQISKGQNLALGTLIMYTKSIQLDEVSVAVSRNVFTTDKQSLYPSEQQVKSSGGGLDLLQKLPIPLLNINPINRTISSWDPSGGVAVLINDIPAEPNDIAIIDPKTVKRVEVIRKPGMEYGSNLSMAINIVIKRAQDGISLGVNSTNSMKLTNGYNNIFATYSHKNSQLTINQSENYQNYSKQSFEDQRQYLLPTGDWHTVYIKSLSARTRSATHGTTVKYNLTKENNFVLQLQGQLNLYRNPKQDRSYLVSETGKSDYINNSHVKDRNQSPALNVYFKKYMPKSQSFIFNIVGTHISSDYNYLYKQADNSFNSGYSISGKKSSVIGEMKYTKGFNWGNVVSGVRSFYGNTQNNYIGDTNSEAVMENVNSNLYAQVNARWKQISGSATFSLDDQFYTQQDNRYHKLTFNPRINLNYSLSPNLSLGYGFNLSSRLPSLSSLNDITIQLDQWERRIGNPYLKPFNHIENSLSATYYNSKLYTMFNVVYATNKNAIMPSITRTDTDGQIFFDNEIQNQRDMKQLVLTAFLRYVFFNNKLIVSGTGSYNFYHADSELYSNKRGFFFGNLKLESYLDKFYLAASVQSRYNSLFAETIWYNEYSSSLSATYSWKNLRVGLTWENPLQRGGTNNRVETLNNVIQKQVRQYNPEAGNNILFTISWNWNYGFKAKVQEAELNNKDSDAGILK